MGRFADMQEDVTPQQAAELVRSGEAQLVDVREPYEHEAGYIDGARHIEMHELTEQAAEIDRDKPVIFYCRVGSRSAMATQAFKAAGYEAYNLDGGIAAWVANGLEIEPEDGTVADH
jgi:rhodanese-related sulfurtransferase